MTEHLILIDFTIDRNNSSILSQESFLRITNLFFLSVFPSFFQSSFLVSIFRLLVLSLGRSYIALLLIFVSKSCKFFSYRTQTLIQNRRNLPLKERFWVLPRILEAPLLHPAIGWWNIFIKVTQTFLTIGWNISLKR